MSHLEHEQAVKVAKARPITALFLGLIFGLAVAVLLQQGGVWPLDKLTVFLLPSLIALIFILIARIGRVSSPGALIIALILLIAPLAYGLTGLGEIDQTGQLNGGCTVEAATDVDTTIVTDTTKSNPFVVVPDGPLAWRATSPGPITDHEWEIYVTVGGFDIVVADGGDENADQEAFSEGDEETLEGYISDLTGQSGEQIRGVYEVGGFISGDGGECDGFGFVEIEGGFLDTIVAWIALIVAVIALILFLLITFTGRTRPIEEESVVVVTDDAGETLADVGGGAGAASIAAGDETDAVPPVVPPTDEDQVPGVHRPEVDSDDGSLPTEPGSGDENRPEDSPPETRQDT